MNQEFLPSRQIRLPGGYAPAEMTDRTDSIHYFSQLPLGRRCQKIVERFYHQDPHQRAYNDDGKVLVPPPPENFIDRYRDVKFFDKYVATYAFQHWPKGLKDRIWVGFNKKDLDGAREFSDREILDRLGPENRRNFHIADELAISTFLWSMLRPTVTGPGEKDKAIAATKYFFSTHPFPLVKYIARNL